MPSTGPRILHVLCDLHGGGAERLVLDLCRLDPPHRRAAVVTLFEGGDWAAEFAAARIPVRSLSPRNSRPGLRELRALVQICAGVDLVHTHLWAGDQWGRLAATLARRPNLSTVHNSRPDGPWAGRVDHLLRPLSDHIVAISPSVERLLIAAGVPAARRSLIPNGIDLGRFAPSPLPPLGPPWRLLAVGRLVPQKGLDLLIRAVKGLPEVELDLLGEGPDRSALQALIGAAGDRLRLRGWVPDVRPFLAAAHLVVVPSRWEGFGLQTVEALAAGRPVVAAAVDALPQLVGAGGLVVPPGDPMALQGAIAALLADPRRLSSLAAAAPGAARPFDIQQTHARYATLYEQVASRSP